MPHQPPPGGRRALRVLDNGTPDQVPIVVEGQQDQITVFIPDFFVREQRIIADTPQTPPLFSTIVQPMSNGTEKSTIEQVILENFEEDSPATEGSTRRVFRKASASEYKVIIRYSHP